MAKQEHPTTCQICGRPIKASTGVIAHHGYQRPGNGWQTASCMGARHLPYEQSCDLIPKAISNVEQFIDNTGLALEAFKTNPPEHLIYFPHNRSGYNHEAVKVERPVDFKPDGYRTYRPGAYDTIYYDRCYDMEQKIKFAKYDLEYLKQRLADWKPVETSLAI